MNLSKKALAVLALLFFAATYCRAQIFVTESGDRGFGEGFVGEYCMNGSTMDASLVSGLSVPQGIAVSGSDMFVADSLSYGINEYTTAGTTVDSDFNTAELSEPSGIAISGSDLFVVGSSGRVEEWTTSGGNVSFSLISGTSGSAFNIAISGSDIFVTDYSYNGIGEFTTSGAIVNRSLISRLGGPWGIAVSGSDLFIAYRNGYVDARDIHVHDMVHAHGLPAVGTVQFKTAHDFQRHAGKVEACEARAKAVGAGGYVSGVQTRRPQLDQTLRIRDAGQQIQVGGLHVRAEQRSRRAANHCPCVAAMRMQLRHAGGNDVTQG